MTIVTISLVIFIAAVITMIVRNILSREDRGKLPSIVIDRKNIPFNLFADDSMIEEFPVVKEGLQGAIDFINDSVHHQMFAELGEFSAGEIIPVMPYDPSDPQGSISCHEKAFAFVRISNGKAEALYINTSLLGSLSDDSIKYGIAHELGHILGLDHDDFTSSLMYSKIAIDRDPTITEKDLELIRLTYGLQ